MGDFVWKISTIEEKINTESFVIKTSTAYKCTGLLEKTTFITIFDSLTKCVNLRRFSDALSLISKVFDIVWYSLVQSSTV